MTISRDQARTLDRRAEEEFGMTGAMLMENAGRGTADVLCQLVSPLRVLIVCGRGNNGGDGFVIARHLDLRGFDVRVLLLGEPQDLRGDAALNHHVMSKAGLAIQSITSVHAGQIVEQANNAEWMIDAMLGTGAKGEPREPYATAIEQMNTSGLPILAVDVPSGLDCDTGEIAQHTIRAQHTCTFVAAKPGFLLPEAKAYLGQVHVLDIGAPRMLVEQMVEQSTGE